MDDSGKQKVLIAGGGVAALEAALALRDLAEDQVSVEVLAPETHFWYRPLSVAAPFQLGETRHFELDTLTFAIGAGFTLGALVAVDSWRQVVSTSANAEIAYDELLIACGAVPTPAIPGALTFRGPADSERVEHLLEELVAGDAHSVAFVIPWGAVWSLPAYELALLTAAYLEEHRIRRVELILATPEMEPLQLFGPPASRAVRELLAARGVSLRTGVQATEFAGGELELFPDGAIAADRAVALPRLRGAPIDGVPQNLHGFIPVDSDCRVVGLDHVFAAGDITSFPVKQGGIAAQQADAAAEAIAAAAGANVAPERFRPVLRGMLLTGREPRYLRRELLDRPDIQPLAALEPLWWPPAKIVGRYLAPFLASIAGAETAEEVVAAVPGTLPLEIELIPETVEELAVTPLQLEFDVEGDAGRVEDVMAADPVVLSPEDTLAEVAEYLVKRDASAGAVVEYGRLVGIVTTADLVRAQAARVHPSDARVRQWMTAEPVTVAARSSAAAAMRLMKAYGVHHLPVVEGDRPIGILDMSMIPEQLVPIGLGY